MRDLYTLTFNFTGGIISPGTLLQILVLIIDAEVGSVKFGLRQQMVVEADGEDCKKLITQLKEKNISFEINSDRYPNLVSSYPAEDVFMGNNWLTEGIYQDIFDEFDYKPHLKINIADQNQTFTPFFTGNINFVASENTNFWHLFVRFPKTNVIFTWKTLVYSLEIPQLARKIEEFILDNLPEFYGNPKADGEKLFNLVEQSTHDMGRIPEKELILPSFNLPYYEGFNRYGNKTWLGIYRRDEQFSVKFLYEVCLLCLKTKIGQICLTPWKSLIIKNITENHRSLWDELLGKFQINVRHAASELNWQIEEQDIETLQLKQKLVKFLDLHDTRTFGLCFAIQTRPKSELFGSVIIRKKYFFRAANIGFFTLYDIFHTEEFNPNSRKLVVFETNLLAIHLPEQIRRICKHFYNTRLPSEEKNSYLLENEEITREKPQEFIYQCQHCQTVYDEKIGEPESQIVEDTTFEDLPENYVCVLCESPKSDFVKIFSMLSTV